MTDYSQLNKFDFYRSYHQNPYNKMIHFICIPMLSICFLNIANIIKSDKFLLCIYCYYYFSFGLKIGLIMTNYLILISDPSNTGHRVAQYTCHTIQLLY